MIMINMEFTKIDKENERVELTYFRDKKVCAVMKFDYNKENTEIDGDLFNLIGYANTDEDKEKYEKYIQNQRWFAKLILDRS